MAEHPVVNRIRVFAHAVDVLIGQQRRGDLQFEQLTNGKRIRRAQGARQQLRADFNQPRRSDRPLDHQHEVSPLQLCRQIHIARHSIEMAGANQQRRIARFLAILAHQMVVVSEVNVHQSHPVIESPCAKDAGMNFGDRAPLIGQTSERILLLQRLLAHAHVALRCRALHQGIHQNGDLHGRADRDRVLRQKSCREQAKISRQRKQACNHHR